MSSVPQPDRTPRDSRGRMMQQLRRQLGRWEAVAPTEDAEMFSSGAAAIDRLLPGGGLRHGMLVEWLGGEWKWSSGAEEQWSSGAEQKWSRGAVEQRNSRAKRDKNYSTTPLLHYSSAATLSLLAAREACREGGALVVIDRQQTFYPPAAAAWGIDLDRLIVVRPQSARDELWAAVQSLRSPAVAAVWGMIDRLDGRAFRRLQLAAQAGRTLGLLLRPPSARGQPSWADVRLMIGNCGFRISDCGLNQLIRNPKSTIRNHSALHPLRHIQVEVLRVRTGRAGSKVTLAIDDTAHTVREVNAQHDTHPLPVARELADPADRSFPARA
jgi:protein ImuA